MLNSKGKRELAYIVKIDDIQPITGSDNCESAVVGGWHIMTRKGTFDQGDVAVYFEIDSLLDTAKPEFAFMEKYHGKVKTQKFTFGGKGNFISQGLLMHPNDFGWNVQTDNTVVDNNGGFHKEEDESRFLTDLLDVHYYDPADEQRKKPQRAKQPVMPKFFYHGIGRKLMGIKWLKKILVFLFGKKVKVKQFPYWVVKTDEERIENLPHLFPGDNTEWIATEKIDGTSTTFTLRKFKKKREFYVCSRNVVFDSDKQKCYYDTNVYTEMADKYDLEYKMNKMLDNLLNKNVEFITIQGETYGGNIQKRNYGHEHRLAIFNVIFGYNDGIVKRLNPIEMKHEMDIYELPTVPIVDEHYKIPATIEEMKAISGGVSKIDGGMREGLVFRTYDGVRSFKSVDNDYLVKYHS